MSIDCLVSFRQQSVTFKCQLHIFSFLKFWNLWYVYLYRLKEISLCLWATPRYMIKKSKKVKLILCPRNLLLTCALHEVSGRFRTAGPNLPIPTQWHVFDSFKISAYLNDNASSISPHENRNVSFLWVDVTTVLYWKSFVASDDSMICT